MKAITIAKPGELDVLELTEVPFPEVAPGNVLIKVRRSPAGRRRMVVIDGDRCRWRREA